MKVGPEPNFQRQDNDLLTEIDISLTRAILGAEVSVPTLDGHVKMRIPAGTQSGRVFRLKEKGIPDLHNRVPGDELVRVNVQIPKNLTAQQRKLVEEFAKVSGEEPDKGSFTDKIKRTFR
ncbi:MAG: DnaJ C-terminal domain-containing protein [Candidatus Omnitrophota bacterium]|nr:DnaJ C-terminal domain-containing protein [Candidatus Omnitrophota bacterium]